MNTTEQLLQRVQSKIRRHFHDVLLEFGQQRLSAHIELWVYVLTMSRFDEVQSWCRSYSRNERLDENDPEIWLLVKTWSGSWPGGDSEQAIHEQQEMQRRRDDFRKRHSIGVAR